MRSSSFRRLHASQFLRDPNDGRGSRISKSITPGLNHFECNLL